MNIVLINHYAGSAEMGMEFRPYYFAKEWIELGHSVSIIAADYSHIRRKNPKVEKDFQKENIEGINYYWIKTNTYDGNGFQRAKTMWKFIRKLQKNVKFILEEMNPDVVICSSTYPLDTYVGQKIRKKSKKKVKLIHEVHDMWPLSLIEIGGMSKNHPFVKVMQIGENSFSKKSDIVVSLLPNAKEHFIEHGMKEDRFRFVSNGIVLAEWENYENIPADLKSHFEEKKRDGYFNLVFFGSIQKTYKLEMLIDTVKQIDDKVFLTLIGPGMDRKELEEYSKGFENKVKFFDPINKKAIPDLFNYMDATFIGLRDQSIARFGIAMNKLFDSMMGGKPIIYMVNAPNNYIDDFDCGITVTEDSVEALKNAIKTIINESEDRKKVMGENGRNAALKYFNYKALGKKFVEIMEE